MNKKTPIYKLNDRVWDALKRFLSSNNPLSYITNIFINCLWLMGKYLMKFVKLILGKKEYVPEEKEEHIVKTISNELNYNDLKQLIDPSNNKLLFIDLNINDNDVSGASDFGKEKILEFEKENKKVILLTYKHYKEELYLSLNSNNQVIKLDDVSNLLNLLDHIHIRNIFINNLAFYPKVEDIINTLIEYKEKTECNITYAFHDYLCICPSYFLLDETGFPCEVNKNGKCKHCLENNEYKVVDRVDVDKWREKYNVLFDNVDSFLFFSEYTRKIVESIYPNIKDRSIVKAHECLLSENHSTYERKKKDNNRINIGFVGHFARTKGADLYIEVINKLKENYKVKSVIIGYADDEYKLDYKVTGRYNRDDLGRLLSENEIDLVIFPSYSNETFSYTVQELMILNVPIVVFDCGAPASRIIQEKYELAQIAKEVSVDSLYDATVKLINKL